MIISETVLKEKYEISDDKMYDYLIDNAETDEQVELLLNLQNMAIAHDDKNTAYHQDCQELKAYMEEQKRVFNFLGIDIERILG